MVSPSNAGLALRVSASTSNVGPGFDLLGLCLSLYIDREAEFGSSGGPHEQLLLGGDAAHWPPPRENLLFRAYDELLGNARPALRLRAHSQIPIGRGFGSSGAAVAAGLLVASALCEPQPAREELVALGLALEGHPDNSTAALLGGCTLALPHARGVRVVPAQVHPAIGFALAWPASPLPTSAARKVLPTSVAFADAIENPRRLAMLLAGLASADPELLRLGQEDRLHTRYRLPLIRGGAEALAAAHAAGAWLATLSGSGSGLLALGAHADMPKIARAMQGALEALDPPAHARVVDIVREAPEARWLLQRS
jgi:homoserine kinase